MWVVVKTPVGGDPAWNNPGPPFEGLPYDDATTMPRRGHDEVRTRPRRCTAATRIDTELMWAGGLMQVAFLAWLFLGKFDPLELDEATARPR